MISFNCKYNYTRYHIKHYRGLGYNPESRCDGYSFILQDFREYSIISTNGNSTKYSKIINLKDNSENDII